MFANICQHVESYDYQCRSCREGRMARKIGDNSRDSANSTAVVMEVRPVRPPSDTPEALSTKVVVVETPRTAPAVVPTASASNAPLIRGKLAVFVQHACFGRYTNQSSDGIKHIYE